MLTSFNFFIQANTQTWNGFESPRI